MTLALARVALAAPAAERPPAPVEAVPACVGLAEHPPELLLVGKRRVSETP